MEDLMTRPYLQTDVRRGALLKRARIGLSVPLWKAASVEFLPGWALTWGYESRQYYMGLCEGEAS